MSDKIIILCPMFIRLLGSLNSGFSGDIWLETKMCLKIEIAEFKVSRTACLVDYAIHTLDSCIFG